MVHDPIFLRPAEALAKVSSVAFGGDNLALKRIVDLASCGLASFINASDITHSLLPTIVNAKGIEN